MIEVEFPQIHEFRPYEGSPIEFKISLDNIDDEPCYAIVPSNENQKTPKQ
jgi:hypothetical protein